MPVRLAWLRVREMRSKALDIGGLIGLKRLGENELRKPQVSEATLKRQSLKATAPV